jgi:hypothetical protein
MKLRISNATLYYNAFDSKGGSDRMVTDPPDVGFRFFDEARFGGAVI